MTTTKNPASPASSSPSFHEQFAKILSDLRVTPDEFGHFINSDDPDAAVISHTHFVMRNATVLEPIMKLMEMQFRAGVESIAQSVSKKKGVGVTKPYDNITADWKKGNHGNLFMLQYMAYQHKMHGVGNEATLLVQHYDPDKSVKENAERIQIPVNNDDIQEYLSYIEQRVKEKYARLVELRNKKTMLTGAEYAELNDLGLELFPHWQKLKPKHPNDNKGLAAFFKVAQSTKPPSVAEYIVSDATRTLATLKARVKSADELFKAGEYRAALYLHEASKQPSDDPDMDFIVSMPFGYAHSEAKITVSHNALGELEGMDNKKLIHLITEGGFPSPMLMTWICMGIGTLQKEMHENPSKAATNADTQTRLALMKSYYNDILPRYEANMQIRKTLQEQETAALAPEASTPPPQPPEPTVADAAVSQQEPSVTHDRVVLTNTGAEKKPRGTQPDRPIWQALNIPAEQLKALDIERVELLARYAQKHAEVFHMLGINAPESQHGEMIGGTRVRKVRAHDTDSITTRAAALGNAALDAFRPMEFYTAFSGRGAPYPQEPKEPTRKITLPDEDYRHTTTARVGATPEERDIIYAALVKRDPQPTIDPTWRRKQFDAMLDDYFACKAEVATALAVPPQGGFITTFGPAQAVFDAVNTYQTTIIGALRETPLGDSTPKTLPALLRDVGVLSTNYSKLVSGQISGDEARSIIGEIQQQLSGENGCGVVWQPDAAARIHAAEEQLIGSIQAYDAAMKPYRIVLADMVADANERFFNEKADGTATNVERLYGRIQRTQDYQTAQNFAHSLSDEAKPAATHTACLVGIYELLGVRDAALAIESPGHYLDFMPPSVRAALAATPAALPLLYPEQVAVGDLAHDAHILKAALLPLVSHHGVKPALMEELIDNLLIARDTLANTPEATAPLAETAAAVARHWVHERGSHGSPKGRISESAKDAMATAQLAQWLDALGGVSTSDLTTIAKSNHAFGAALRNHRQPREAALG